jgi:hypothetical protein
VFHCLLNKEFPWVHIVKGKPLKPNTQSSVKVSHLAFKIVLVKWLDSTGSDNWILGAQQQQKYMWLLEM